MDPLARALSLLACPLCRASLELIPLAGADAVARCAGCSSWYRVEGGVPELLPVRLQDRARRDAFRLRHEGRWRGWAEGREDAARPDDAHKLEQKSFYDEDALVYESSMLKLPFWRAFDRLFREYILAEAGGTLAEIGCGTGRISLPCRGSFEAVIGLDISEAMVRTGVEKRDALGDAAHIVYTVADAENIPLRDASVDAVVLSGILHHVENPGRVLAESLRVLKPGGRFWGLENNRSAFRPVFDLLMAVSRAWNEKAHEENFIMSVGQVRDWIHAAGADPASVEAWTGVFLPPHAFNMLDEESAYRLLKATDASARRVPWLSAQGGLLVFKGRKPA